MQKKQLIYPFLLHLIQLMHFRFSYFPALLRAVQTGVRSVPSGLVCHRWTRGAHVAQGAAMVAEALARDRVEDNATIQSIAYATTMELVGMCRGSRQAFEVGVDFINRAKQAMSSMTVKDPSIQRNAHQDIPVNNPDDETTDVGNVATPQGLDRMAAPNNRG